MEGKQLVDELERHFRLNGSSHPHNAVGTGLEGIHHIGDGCGVSSQFVACIGRAHNPPNGSRYIQRAKKVRKLVGCGAWVNAIVQMAAKPFHPPNQRSSQQAG